MRHLVGKHLTVSGFDVGRRLEERSKLGQPRAARLAAAVLKVRGTVAEDRVDLQGLADGYARLGDRQSEGKTLVFPNGLPSRESRASRKGGVVDR